MHRFVSSCHLSRCWWTETLIDNKRDIFDTWNDNPHNLRSPSGRNTKHKVYVELGVPVIHTTACIYTYVRSFVHWLLFLFRRYTYGSFNKRIPSVYVCMYVCKEGRKEGSTEMVVVGFWWEAYTHACVWVSDCSHLGKAQWQWLAAWRGGRKGRGFVSHHSFWAIEGLVGSGEILGGPRPLGPSATCPHVCPPFVLLPYTT